MTHKISFLALVILISGCLSSAPTKSEASFSASIDGQELSYRLSQQGDITVGGLYLVGQGGTYDYALQYDAPKEGVAMLYVIANDEAKMVRRITIPQGKGVLNFNANSDWVENAEEMKLELSMKGSSKKTILLFEGR
ncbi:hypothetical protein [Thermospira aquatica]|uniref:Lipoprotein n=1 Tax=Thermospira aquatica TaxID=2828656 RepID=A0AAX3BFV8_9SPIR|nr:hypothetical protein [Thermospira aquatica]URA11192.1 hypothetical protein KDW03_05200 [Thermospira aquatica]